MRRLVLVALLVPFAAGCGWLGSFSSGHSSSSAQYSTTVTLHQLAPVASVGRWIKVEQLPKRAVAGAKLFESSGCIACHVYAGTGSRNLNAPSLTSIGRRHLGIRFQIAHLRCPSCAVKESPMPPFRSLGKRRLHQLAVFLEASKGTH